MAYLQAKPELSAGRLDSTVAPQNKGLDPALGRSRGGISTKIHSLADQRGPPLCLRLTGGQHHDST